MQLSVCLGSLERELGVQMQLSVCLVSLARKLDAQTQLYVCLVSYTEMGPTNATKPGRERNPSMRPGDRDRIRDAHQASKLNDSTRTAPSLAATTTRCVPASSAGRRSAAAIRSHAVPGRSSASGRPSSVTAATPAPAGVPSCRTSRYTVPRSTPPATSPPSDRTVKSYAAHSPGFSSRHKPPSVSQRCQPGVSGGSLGRPSRYRISMPSSPR